MGKKVFKKALISIVAVLLIFALCFVIYISIYYHAQNTDIYLISDDVVTVEKIENGYLFDGPGEETAYIFYPGAKVESEAYAPLMHKLSACGIDCFLVTMPVKIAFFGRDIAADILETYNYEHWYIGGHSLGGFVSTTFAHENESQFDGIILLSAYAMDDFTDSNLKVLIIYGDQDEVINLSKVEEGRDFMPESYSEIIIPGGNHAQMGSYGTQRGDGEATITGEDQISQVADSILEFIG